MGASHAVLGIFLHNPFYLEQAGELASAGFKSLGLKRLHTLPSLLALKPEEFGLPPFQDNIEGTIPVDPAWRIKGAVVKGFGRGNNEK